MHELQDDNDLAVFQFNQRVFDGSMISARIEKVPERAPIIVKHYQDWVEALAKAKTRGAKFTVTGGGNVTSNDMFKSIDMGVREN